MIIYNRPSDEIVTNESHMNGYLIVTDKVYEVYTEKDLFAINEKKLFKESGIKYNPDNYMYIHMSCEHERMVFKSGLLTIYFNIDNVLWVDINIDDQRINSLKISDKGMDDIMNLLDELTYNNVELLFNKLNLLAEQYRESMCMLNDYWPDNKTKKR